MSVSSQISRLTDLRNELRSDLQTISLTDSTSDLEDCVDAVETFLSAVNSGGYQFYGTINDSSGDEILDSNGDEILGKFMIGYKSIGG